MGELLGDLDESASGNRFSVPRYRLTLPKPTDFRDRAATVTSRKIVLPGS